MAPKTKVVDNLAVIHNANGRLPGQRPSGLPGNRPFADVKN